MTPEDFAKPDLPNRMLMSPEPRPQPNHTGPQPTVMFSDGPGNRSTVTLTLPRIPEGMYPMVEAMIRTFTEDIGLTIKKNTAYGNGNLALTGLQGIVVRLLDKAMRLKSLVLDGNPGANFESVEDTLRDASNYARFGVVMAIGEYPGVEGLATEGNSG